MDADRITVKITMDGNEYEVEEGITILDAARKNGIYIPTLCYHSVLSTWGGCRMCIVEVDGAPKLVASCVTPVRNGMEVVTSNDRIIESRRIILEFLFAERNHNCMFCPQSGDCELQKLAYELQMDHLTVSSSFNRFPTDVTNEYMAMDHNRCILCGRCVRACAEIAGNHVLNFQNRGPKNLIGLDLNESREGSSCHACGACLQVCPTGALTSRYRTHYGVKGHSRDWKEIESVCPQCGLLCPTVSFVSGDNLVKVEGRLGNHNGRPDRGQLCYKGRFEVLKSRGRRLLRPMVREGRGPWVEESWEKAVGLAAEGLKAVRDKGGQKGLFGLASSAVSNEDLLFFKDLMAEGWSAGHVDTLDGLQFRALSKVWNNGFKEAPWNRIPEADFILVAGANPYRSQPAIASLIRQAVMERGVKVGVIGEVDCIPSHASYPVAVEPGSEPLLMEAMAAAVIYLGEDGSRGGKKTPAAKKGKGDVSHILKRAGINEEQLGVFWEMARAFSGSENPLIIVGEGIADGQNPGALGEAAKMARSKGRHSKDTSRLLVLKPFGNSAGAWRLGVPSQKDVRGKEAWKGGVVLLGGEEDERKGLLADIGDDLFLVVISPYFPEFLADKARVLLPRPDWMEEDGTYTSLDGREAALKKRVLRPPEGVMETWRTLTALADGTGFSPHYATWHDLSREAESRIRSNECRKQAQTSPGADQGRSFLRSRAAEVRSRQ